MDRAGAGRSPALEHSFGGETGENADHRDATSRSDVPAGGVIANIQMTALDASGEAREGAVPHRDARTRASDCAFDAIGFLAASASIDQNRSRKLPEQLFFESVRDSFSWILTDPEADRGRDLDRIKGG